MTFLKGKMIVRGNSNLSFVGWIIIANQVLLSSMWYMATYWNPNPRMCNQIRGWFGTSFGEAKCLKPEQKPNGIPSCGGLGIKDPKAQSKALLTKLLVWGLSPSGEPWKEILKHYVDQIQLPVIIKAQEIMTSIGFLLPLNSRKRLVHFGKTSLDFG
jgi:hypothetical protein